MTIVLIGLPQSVVQDAEAKFFYKIFVKKQVFLKRDVKTPHIVHTESKKFGISKKGGILMDEKKLSPEEVEQKIENIRKNLMTRVYAIYREDRTGSIETRKSYFGAESRFCGFLAEHYRLQNIKNVETRHLRAYVEHLQDEGRSASYIDATLVKPFDFTTILLRFMASTCHILPIL